MRRRTSIWAARWLALPNAATKPSPNSKPLSSSIPATPRDSPTAWAPPWRRCPAVFPDAIKEFQTAAELQPDFAEAHNNLGRALSQLPGRMPDALAEYHMALRLRPDYSQAQINLEAALHGNHP